MRQTTPHLAKGIQPPPGSIQQSRQISYFEETWKVNARVRGARSGWRLQRPWGGCPLLCTVGPAPSPVCRPLSPPADTVVLCRGGQASDDKFCKSGPGPHATELLFDYANAVPWWGLVTTHNTRQSPKPPTFVFILGIPSHPSTAQSRELRPREEQ